MKRSARWISGLLLAAVPLGLFVTIRIMRARQEDCALRWVEKYIRYAQILPSRHQNIWNLNAVCEGNNAIAKVEKKFGVSARSRVDFGQLEFLADNFKEAQVSFDQASRLSPRDESVKSKIASWHHYQRVIQGIACQLPKGCLVTTVAPIVIERQTFWAVIFGQAHANSSGGIFDTGGAKVKDDSLRLAIFSQQNAVWRQDQQFSISKEGVFPINHQFFIQDTTGDTQPELIVSLMCFDSGGNRDYVQVFAWQNQKFVRIYDQPYRLSTWFDDLDHDGKYEIGSYIEIGGMVHAGQPRWQDIYAYKHERYVLANNDFPQEFRQWSHELREVLKIYPRDFGIWYYLGQAYETQKQFGPALKAFKQAKTLILNSPDAKEPYNRVMLKEIRAHIRAVQVR